MWIEIEFDESVFPEHVWDGWYLNAKALRYDLGHLLRHVRIAARQDTVTGEPRPLIAFTVELDLGGRPAFQTIEVGPRGFWRAMAAPAETEAFAPLLRRSMTAGTLDRGLDLHPAGAGGVAGGGAASEVGERSAARPAPADERAAPAPFAVYLPDARFDYERDLLTRPELRVTVLRTAIAGWLEAVVQSDPSAAPIARPTALRLREAGKLAQETWKEQIGTTRPLVAGGPVTGRRGDEPA